MKRLILVILMVFAFGAAHCQKFHPEARRWEEDGVRKFEKSLYNNDGLVFGGVDTYRVSRDRAGVFVTLSNTKNRLYGTPQKYLDGSEVVHYLDGDIKYLEAKNIQQKDNIIRRHLGLYSLAGSWILYEFVLDMSGRIREVVFRFSYDSPQSMIPPMVYSRLEQELKMMVSYIIPQEERIYNFITVMGSYDF